MRWLEKEAQSFEETVKRLAAEVEAEFQSSSVIPDADDIITGVVNRLEDERGMTMSIGEWGDTYQQVEQILGITPTE
jgi:hypothetical protein